MRVSKSTTFITTGALALALGIPVVAQDGGKPAPCGPKGSHPLLERMTAAFHLTCEQKLQIAPYLHDEHLITRPLLAFDAFSPEDKTAFMAKVKVAARNQIKPLLTPEQQKRMDQDIESVSDDSGIKGVGEGWEAKKKGRTNGGGKAKKDEGANSDAAEANQSRRHSKKPLEVASAFEAEEALCAGVQKYSALSPDQKREMILEVKKAARRSGAPQLTPEQEKKIDADIKQLMADSKS